MDQMSLIFAKNLEKLAKGSYWWPIFVTLGKVILQVRSR